MLCAEIANPSQGQGRWKLYKIVVVNGTYTHGKYESVHLKSLCVMYNINVFAAKDGQPTGVTTAGQPAGQTPLIT